MNTKELLSNAMSCLDVAQRPEGPETSRDCELLAIGYALVAIAQELKTMNERNKSKVESGELCPTCGYFVPDGEIDRDVHNPDPECTCHLRAEDINFPSPLHSEDCPLHIPF